MRRAHGRDDYSSAVETGEPTPAPACLSEVFDFPDLTVVAFRASPAPPAAVALDSSALRPWQSGRPRIRGSGEERQVQGRSRGEPGLIAFIPYTSPLIGPMPRIEALDRAVAPACRPSSFLPAFAFQTSTSLGA